MESELVEFAPIEWRRLPIEAICSRVTSGGTPSRKRPDFYIGGRWNWVKTQELIDSWIDTTEEKITDDAIASSSAKVLPPNTVLLALYGATVGQLGILRKEMTCNQACCALIVDPSKADYRFLFYQLLASRSQLKRLATGAAQQNLSGQLIKTFKLPFPPIKEQKAIACILGALDDKIELNRRRNETLEGMARAVFQSWFVDFDPVRAKATGCTPTGLKPELASLFPVSFQDSALGQIPSGWNVKTISDVTYRVTKGDTPRNEALKSASEDERWIPMLRVNAITDEGEILIDKAERIPESIHLGKSKRSILEPNDILYTNAGTIGRVAFVHPELLPANTNQAIAIVKPNPAIIPPGYLYMTLRRAAFQAELHKDIVQAVQANLALGKISDARFVLPSEDLLQILFSPINAILNQIWQIRKQSRTLSTLRQTLLPNLISGELRISDAERIVARAI